MGDNRINGKVVNLLCPEGLSVCCVLFETIVRKGPQPCPPLEEVLHSTSIW